MIGVLTGYQGRGIARRLLDAVHEHARERPGVEGVSLTTESHANLPLYERFGYELVGHGAIDEGLETWVLFRASTPH